MLKSLIFSIPVLFLSFFNLQAQQLEDLPFVVNGNVNDMCRKGNTLYLAGQFSKIVPKTGTAANVNILDNSVDFNFPVINGTVNVIKSDGSGGWFVGGVFTMVGDSVRNNFVHINSNYSIDAWNPNPNGGISDILVTGNRIIIGGAFTIIGANARNRIASINLSTKLVEAWNPNANNTVRAIELVNTTLYVGGFFTNIGGQARKYLASVDVATGAVSSWNPTVNSGTFIADIVSGNNMIYVGGNFQTISSQSRNNAASFDISSGNITSWNPYTNGQVLTLCYKPATVSGSVYLGGSFTTISNGTITRNNVACVDANDAYVSPFWDPNVSGIVYKIDIYGGNILIGGIINSIKGLNTTCHVALVDVSDATALLSFKPLPNGSVTAMCVTGDKVLLGGTFTGVGGLNRTNLAAIDLATGQPTSWAPVIVGSPIQSIAMHGDTLYVAGYLTSVNGLSKNYFAGISTVTGLAGTWKPLFNNSINKILIKNNTLYVAGLFTSVGAVSRNYFAAFDLTNGALLPFNPTFGANVMAMDIEGNVLYVGGLLGRLYAIDLTTENVLPFNPTFNDNVFAIDAIGDKVYVGGRFTTANGVARNRLARFNASTSTLDQWNPNADDFILSLTAYKTSVYIGGNFLNVGGSPRMKFVAVDTAKGQLQPFNPVQTTNAVYTVKVDNDKLYLGMSSTSLVQNSPLSGYCIFKNLPVYSNTISGKIIIDVNANCAYETSDQYFPGMIVQALPGPIYSIADSSGVYKLAVDTGDYQVNQVINRKQFNIITPLCPNTPGYYDVDLTQPYVTTNGNDFYNKTTDCSYLTIVIGSTRGRACYRNRTVAKYCNIGGGVSPAGEVNIIYPKHFTTLSSSPTWDVKNGKEFTYYITPMQPGECRYIELIDSVDCNDRIAGTVDCFKASISPRNNCNVPSSSWDGSEIEVNSVCDNDYAKFEINNTGIGGMADSAEFRIYYDGVLGFSHNYKLIAGGNLTVNVLGNGKAITLEADQRPYYPFYGKASSTISDCGSTTTTGSAYFLSLPNGDYDSHISISCRTIVNSHDPNEKEVIPSGVGLNHYVLPNEMLNYTIHFQNTGTDTAFNVVIVDTLDSDLDISSLEMGVASHHYKLSISGHGNPILTWTFKNINLPDSTANASGSMGFINFSIDQKPNNSNGTLLTNKSYIFFDYNDAIITNETSLTVQDQLPEDLGLGSDVIIGSVVTSVTTTGSTGIKVYPNPSSSAFNFELSEASQGSTQLVVTDLSGTKIFEDIFEGKKYILDRNYLTPGVYLYKLVDNAGGVYWGKIVAF